MLIISEIRGKDLGNRFLPRFFLLIFCTLYVQNVLERVKENLKWLASEHAELLPSITLRLPHIPDYNTEEDINNSQAFLETLGYHKFDRFDYIIR